MWWIQHRYVKFYPEWDRHLSNMGGSLLNCAVHFLDLIQQWARYNDWTWGYNGVPFAYSDNSTVTIQPRQNVTFVGVRYIYRFR